MRKKKTRQKKVLYGELGSFCIDFTKYMATGVVITTLLKDLEGHNALIYSGGFVLVSGFLFLGLLFIKLKEDYLLFMGMGLGFLIWALYMEGKFHRTKKKKK